MAPGGRSSGPEFQDWLGAREPSLQRTAHLLTGDVDRAQPLVLETLARLYLGWGRVRRSDDIDADARALLLRAYRTSTRGDTAAVGRAVVVLRHHDRLTDLEIAELMRTSVGAVQAVDAPDPTAVDQGFSEITDDTAYPVTPLTAVVARAREIRRARRRTTVKVTAAGVGVAAVASVVFLGVGLVRGGDDVRATPPVAPLPQLRLGAAPEVGYLDGDTFVSSSGDRFTSPTFHRALTVAEYDNGVFVAGRLSSRRPFVTISRIIRTSTVHVGCGTPAFVLDAGGGDPTYWLSDSCRAVDSRRLVYGDTGRLILGPTRATTTGVVAYTPVGRVSDGVVAFGVSESATVGNATYVLQSQDGASRLVSHVAVPRGATTNGDLVSGLAPNLTDSLVVDADSGSVRWRLPDWSLGRFSASGRYVVGFRSAGLPHLGAVNDSVGIWEAATGHEVLVRDLPGLMLDSLPVWEDEDSVLVVAEDRSGHQAIIRVDTDGTVTRATRVGSERPDGFRLAATP